MCCTIYVFLTTHAKENQWIYVFNLLSSFRGLTQGELQSIKTSYLNLTQGYPNVTNVQQANWTEMNWTVLFCVIIYYRLNSITVSLFILLIIYQSVFDRAISRLSRLKPVAYIISVVSHIGVSE